jgi:hypothetical protein
VILLAPLLLMPAGRATAQYSLVSPSGQELRVSQESLVQLDDTTRALRKNLEEDPRVLYYTAFGDPLSAEPDGAAYPWAAVEVITDSTAAVVTPGNLREADRAYANYAVLRMEAVRSDLDVSCDSVFALEERAVSGFVDGWLVSRTLYGGPPYPPLDELAFARQAGHLAGLMAARSDRQLGGCLAVWTERHPDRLDGYERWRRVEFLGEPADTSPSRADPRRR